MKPSSRCVIFVTVRRLIDRLRLFYALTHFSFQISILNDLISYKYPYRYTRLVNKVKLEIINSVFLWYIFVYKPYIFVGTNVGYDKAHLLVKSFRKKLIRTWEMMEKRLRNRLGEYKLDVKTEIFFKTERYRSKQNNDIVIWKLFLVE